MSAKPWHCESANRPDRFRSGLDEIAFREMIYGNRRGAVASLARLGLGGLAPLYSLAVRARNRAFDLGLKPVRRVPVPVISVGNITTGGTGKTPVVAFLANWFQERGIRVTLLSRGYRSLSDSENDEKRLLDRLCPGIVHLQNPDRVASAERACREHNAEILILDDGFQHRRLARDLDIVLIDASNPFGYGHLLPRGLLREPLSALRRADLIVLTRADQCSPAEKFRIAATLNSVGATAERLEAAFQPRRLVNAAGERAELSSLDGKPVAGFCAIGNPDAFRDTLTNIRTAVASFTPFPDHHSYQTDDLERLGRQAALADVAAILTTQKDLVKIDRTHLGGRPLWAVEVSTVILNGESILQHNLIRLLDGISPGAMVSRR